MNEKENKRAYYDGNPVVHGIALPRVGLPPYLMKGLREDKGRDRRFEMGFELDSVT